MNHQFIGTFFRICHNIPNLLSNFSCGLIPRDSLPFSLASFSNSLHRIEDSIFLIHNLRVLNSLVAASWIEIWNFCVNSWISCRLILSCYNSVMRPNFPCAVSLTVYTVISKTVLLFFTIGKRKLISIHLFGISCIWIVMLTVFYAHYFRFGKQMPLSGNQSGCSGRDFKKVSSFHCCAHPSSPYR